MDLRRVTFQHDVLPVLTFAILILGSLFAVVLVLLSPVIFAFTANSREKAGIGETVLTGAVYAWAVFGPVAGWILRRRQRYQLALLAGGFAPLGIALVVGRKFFVG